MRPQGQRVAIVVDNPIRDLTGLVLLAAGLAERGAACHLVPMHVQEQELRSLAPDAVVLNYLRPTNLPLARQLLEAQVAVFVLDTEGGVVESPDAYGRTLTSDAQVRAGVAAWCAWGPELADFGVAAGWFSRDQTVITGAPRFDLYADPWRAAAPELAQALTDGGSDEPLILINSNFPIVNPRFSTVEAEGEMLVRDFGWTVERFEQTQEVQEQSMRELVAVAHALARSHRATVVYRPHPFERIETYEPLLHGPPNLHLRREGGVDGWILQASAVVQRSCTTAIEAAISGVPALSPRWVPAVVEMEAAERVSVPCESIDELDEHVALALRGELQPSDAVSRALDDTIRRWFTAIDGRAHDRVADVVLDRSQVNDRRVHAHRCRAIGDAEGVLGRAKVGLKRHLPPEMRRLRPGPADKRWRAAQKAFGAHDVDKALRALIGAGHLNPAITSRPSGHRDQGAGLRFTRSVQVSIGSRS